MEGHEYRLASDEFTCAYSAELGCAVIRVPGCAEASCISLLLAAQAVGVSRIFGVRKCRQVLDVVGVLDALGISVARENGCYVVEGVGVGGLAEPYREICVGYSPLVACMTIGMLAVHPFSTFLFGGYNHRISPDIAVCGDDDVSMVMEMLTSMGARFIYNGAAFPALVIGTDECVPAAPDAVIPSDAVKSAMLLSCIGVAGKSSIRAKSTLGGYTELLLKQLGARICVERTGCSTDTVIVNGQQELVAGEIYVPAPTSGVLYAVAAAVMMRGIPVLVPGILVDDVVRGVLNVFIRMGAYVALVPNRGLCDAKIRVGVLRGVKIERAELRNIAMNLPAICAVCACAVGTTTITGLSTLGNDARDELDMAATGLAKCGVKLSMGDDSLTIRGCGNAVVAGCERDGAAVSRIAAHISASIGGHASRGLMKYVKALSNFMGERGPRGVFVQDTSDEKSS
ncbi:3-phosphoshikimate 1-carboxyvinyltransferase [Anaplasma centrale]|nr:3-phosphoshikimate 1-carboxyvinyltransferase [Anaplasma centrale]